jgi:cysteine desulfurase
LAFHSLDESGARLAALRDRLEARLEQVLGKQMTVNGRRAPRLPNTSSVNFLGLSSADLLARIPEICAGTASACHSGLGGGRSPTLAAMGVDPNDVRGTIRLSVGWFTSEEDIDRAAELLLGAWEALR